MSGFLLHLLRHGAPERTGRMMGRTDCPPTPDGIAACVDQAGTLPVETLVASDLARARLAGEALGAVLALPLKIDPRWRELDFGDWDGRAASELDPAALGRFWDDPDGNPPPGGERWSALTSRVAAAIDALPARDTLVIAHGGAMRAALAVLCGFDQRQIWAFDLPYASLLSLQVWPGERRSARIVGLWP
ncbi:histidine phosphatase family protein [Sphingomonas colocasiae]|uniref:Histidine phosphatase family protein n=1 Tax=Sphingomonas colocasiae TaxID=1848973 RepID=A0ABS7PQX0_9SPHN|nr:histidine phosphatase family protein [Sphingomonas colocasiae]MBY8823623.1 histidine phosphatase family protein [Sphingomonas colocasiae]